MRQSPTEPSESSIMKLDRRGWKERLTFRGIVIQGAGAGQISPSARAAAAVLKEQGIPVVASLRPDRGASAPGPYEQAL